MPQRFYVTTPIYYVNASPHVGNAYTTLVADALARYHRLRGHRTHFLTGTDEHGLKMEREARKQGITPQAFVDRMSQRFRDAWKTLDASPDAFLRTTEAAHREAVQKYWKRCEARGDLYLGTYKGLYCVACEEHKTEKDLDEGRLCPIHKRPVEELEEPSYFFRLSAYQERLLALYRGRPEFVRPEGRLNEVVSFVEGGLRDLSVSRTSFSWGVPVPGDPKHVMYVWFDALFNYLTALETAPTDLREAFWPPDVQFVGKDILRFHAVYWPAFLMSAGFTEAELPRTIWSHGFLTSGGGKIGKTPSGEPGTLSPGTRDPVRIAEVLGADPLRYFLLREVALGQDGEFNLPAVIQRARSELTETVGNLLNRALPFAKHFDCKVPEAPEARLTDAERALRARSEALSLEASRAWDAVCPHRALEHTVELARAGNKYFDDQAPWALAKKGELDRLAVVLRHVLELVRAVAVLLWPAIPSRSDALRAQLGLDPMSPREEMDHWPLSWGGLATHAALSPGQPVFPRYDKLTEASLLKELGVEAQVEKSSEVKPSEVNTAPKLEVKNPEGVITYDDFARVDLRAGRVLQAERIPKKDQLLRLTVDLGEEAPRTIIAGIAQSYAPEALVGKQLVLVVNLAPRDFGKGLVSHGMLLACGPKEALSVVTLERDLPPGTRVK
ncbi:MAG: methionine--tRNA ligase [Deltaproteobacteria bacterium]|nr:methionine--tRNA ligase [Deltaproteobacteria bacterium]